MGSPHDRRGPCGTSATSGAGRGARRRLAGGACDCSRPVSHPAPTQHGVVSYVCPHSRIAAVSLAEFVAVHIVLEKLPVAILNHQQFRVKYYYSQSSFRTPPVPSVFEDNPVYRRRRRERAPLSLEGGGPPTKIGFLWSPNLNLSRPRSRGRPKPSTKASAMRRRPFSAGLQRH